MAEQDNLPQPPPWPKPTEEQAERAKQIARERGWLDGDGRWDWPAPVPENEEADRG